VLEITSGKYAKRYLSLHFTIEQARDEKR
jgi:hypothetical protein